MSGLAATSEVDARQHVPPVAAYDRVGDNGANHGHDDADYDLRNPILHGAGILMIGGGIWTRLPEAARA